MLGLIPHVLPLRFAENMQVLRKMFADSVSEEQLQATLIEQHNDFCSAELALDSRKAEFALAASAPVVASDVPPEPTRSVSDTYHVIDLKTFPAHEFSPQLFRYALMECDRYQQDHKQWGHEALLWLRRYSSCDSLYDASSGIAST
jgi:hypothetical protein